MQEILNFLLYTAAIELFVLVIVVLFLGIKLMITYIINEDYIINKLKEKSAEKQIKPKQKKHQKLNE